MKIDSWLLDILACPNCRGALAAGPAEADGSAEAPNPAGAPGPAESRNTGELVCSGECHYSYPVRDGIPVLLVDEARAPQA